MVKVMSHSRQTAQFSVRHLPPIYLGIVSAFQVETTSISIRTLAIICSTEPSNALTRSAYDLLKFPRWQTEDYCKHYSSLTFHYAELAFLPCFDFCYRSEMGGGGYSQSAITRYGDTRLLHFLDGDLYFVTLLQVFGGLERNFLYLVRITDLQTNLQVLCILDIASHLRLNFTNFYCHLNTSLLYFTYPA